MYCASETCPNAWGDTQEEKCYDCDFFVKSLETIKPKEEEQEDCPGQLFFSFFAPSLP